MSAPVLTRWPIVFELSAEPWLDEARAREACGHWFAEARRAYFEHCASLQAADEAGPRLVLRSERLTLHRPLSVPATVAVAAGVIELRDHSIDMQMRVRNVAEGEVVASGTCTVGFVDVSTQAPVPLPEVTRREVIALERSAASYC